MTRRDDRQQPGMRSDNRMMRRGGDLLFAGMRAGREPYGSRADLMAQLVERRRVRGERLRGGFWTAGPAPTPPPRPAPDVPPGHPPAHGPGAGHATAAGP